MAGVENADYVSQLNESNPTSADFISQGDDHLRLVKETLKNTFPGFNRPVDGDLIPWEHDPMAVTVAEKLREGDGRLGALENFVDPAHPDGAILRANNNLSDVADPAEALANLGVPDIGDAMLRGNNLGDVDDVVEARLNLGVPEAGTVLEKAQNLADIPDHSIARMNLDVPQKGTVLEKYNNLSDLDSDAVARSNLGVPATGDVLLKSDSLSGIASPTTARANLGVYSTGEVDSLIASMIVVADTGRTIDLAVDPLPPDTKIGDKFFALSAGTVNGIAFNAPDANGNMEGFIVTGVSPLAITPIKKGIPDAPSDGKQYARKDGAWDEVQQEVREYVNFAAFPVTGSANVIYIDKADEKSYYWDSSAYVALGGGMEEYANFASLPVSGSSGVVYVTTDTNQEYRWDGSAYVKLGTIYSERTVYSGKYYREIRTPALSANDSIAIPTPAGTGGLSLGKPDGTATGGNNIGDRAVSLITGRNAATQAATGVQSIGIGYRATSSGANSFAAGNWSTASGSGAFAFLGTASGGNALAFTAGANASYADAMAFGSSVYASSTGVIAMGGSVIGQDSVGLKTVGQNCPYSLIYGNAPTPLTGYTFQFGRQQHGAFNVMVTPANAVSGGNQSSYYFKPYGVNSISKCRSTVICTQPSTNNYGIYVFDYLVSEKYGSGIISQALVSTEESAGVTGVWGVPVLQWVMGSGVQVFQSGKTTGDLMQVITEMWRAG